MVAFETDHVFHGSIAELYEKHFVPLIFETYAQDMVERVKALQPGKVLEIAAGTGVLTRLLAGTLTDSVVIVATDLNPGMLQVAQARGTSRPVVWREADAMALPFADDEFDVVVCQFGAMFFPDRSRAFAEARRVLKPGGVFLFSTWDGIETNEFAATATDALAKFFPDDPPQFMVRTPHGYFDHATIRADLAAAGFASGAEIAVVERRSRCESPEVTAVAYCQGTPSRSEIEARGPGRLLEATEAVAAALAERFGKGVIEGRIVAHIVTVPT